MTPVHATVDILQYLDQLQLSPSTIDVAELQQLHGRHPEVAWAEFLADQLATVLDSGRPAAPSTTDVVPYGFGRIARLLARLMIASHGAPNGLRLRAVVVRQGGPNDLVKRASLLRRDTVHGPFDGTITVDPVTNTITANGAVIQIINASDASTVDYFIRGRGALRARYQDHQPGKPAGTRSNCSALRAFASGQARSGAPNAASRSSLHHRGGWLDAR